MSEFGKYLREVRTSKKPSISQEGKTAPPKGELLAAIIDALGATEDEARELRFLAASQRGSVPDDIYEYFFSSSLIYSAIKTAKETGVDEAAWARFLSSMEDGNATAE